jgi:hypothetical protein
MRVLPEAKPQAAPWPLNITMFSKGFCFMGCEQVASYASALSGFQLGNRLFLKGRYSKNAGSQVGNKQKRRKARLKTQVRLCGFPPHKQTAKKVKRKSIRPKSTRFDFA